MLVTVWLGFCYSMAKPPDWAMESWTALNIKEFTLFDMFQDPFVNTKGGKNPTTTIKIPQSMSEFQRLETLKENIYMRAVNRKLRSGDESRFSEPTWSSG